MSKIQQAKKISQVQKQHRKVARRAELLSLLGFSSKVGSNGQEFDSY